MAAEENLHLFVDFLRTDECLEMQEAEEPNEVFVWNNEVEVDDALREYDSYFIVIKSFRKTEEGAEPLVEFFENLALKFPDPVFGKIEINNEESKYFPCEHGVSLIFIRKKFVVGRLDGEKEILENAEQRIKKLNLNFFN